MTGEQHDTSDGEITVLTRWRGLPGLVWVLVAARAVNRLGAFTLPFLSVTLVQSFGASVVQAGWLLSAFGLATIPSRLLGGRLADRAGARATITAGLVLTAAAQLALAAAPSLLVAEAAVVVLGLVFEVYEPASQSLVADATTDDQRPVAYGLLAAAMAAAGMATGLLAAALAELDLRWLFVVDAATCLACALLAGGALPQDPVDPRRRDGPVAWRDPRLLVLLGTGAVFAVVYLQVTVALPLTVVARGLPVSLVGVLLSVSAGTVVLGQPLLASRLADRVDDFSAMAGGYLLLAAGLVVNGFARSPAVFVLAAVVWSLGDLVLLGRAYAVVASLVPQGHRGEYLAAYGVSWGLAAVIAPVVGTALLAYGGPPLAWTVCAGLCLALGGCQPVVRRVVAGRA